MNKQSIIAGLVIFALIVVGMFTFTYLKKKELMAELPAEVPTQEQTIAEKYGISQIDTTHYFIDGKHTFVGEILMPTPCDLLEVEALVMESFPEQIRLDFTVINTADACAQVITPQRFSVEAVASAEASTTAYFMNEPVLLNITPARAGETPEEFEVYIKG